MLSQTAWAQSISVKIYGTDTIGSDSLVIGNSTLATNHIDAGLGEEEQPVTPPTFDIRSVNLNNFQGLGRDTCLQGLKLNLHHQVRNTQTDAWKIQFQSDDSGSTVTFSWQDGLDTVGGGGWLLIDGSPDIINGAHFLPVDMTQVTNFTYPLMSTQPVVQNIVIKHFDGLKLVSADAESLANAHDTKNKIGALQKLKAYHVDFSLTATNGTSKKAKVLHIELPGASVPLTGSPFNLSAPGTQSNPDGKGKKWDITLDDSVNGGGLGSVVVSGTFVGSKPGNISYWWLDGTTIIDKMKTKTIPPSIPRLPMPNWWNVVYELYIQNVSPYLKSVSGKPWGLVVGGPISVDGKTGHAIYHPKWNDVLKSLYKSKQGTHKGGLKYCLSTFDKDGKDMFLKDKPLKTLAPDKHKDEVFAEALTLKFNLAINSNPNPKVENPNVFGDLLYVGGSHTNDATLNNLTLDQISTALDSFLTCRPGNGAMSAMTGPEVLAVVHDINHAFSAVFDTTSWSGKLRVRGAKAVGDVAFLYRPSAVIPPVIIAPYKEVTEVPLKYNLDQNYPNPFNPTTTISFTLPQDGFVTLKVYNLLGQEIATLVNREEMSEGLNEVDFDASTLSSGVYFYRLIVNDGKFQEVKKMMLLK
jgi:hypothetical protein